MTKEKLLDLIKQYGSFWYVDKVNYIAMGTPEIIEFKQAPASEVNHFGDLIEKSLVYPDSRIILSEYGLVLLGGYYISAWTETLPRYPGANGVSYNYSNDECELIRQQQ